MAATNINRVIITGNLTSDPELRSLPSGTSVCKLRVACNTRRKDNSTGEWVDKPNYFDVTVWGAQGENCARYLSKGRPVAIDGRLEWREWQGKDGKKRQAIDIIADAVQFLSSPRDDGGAAAATASAPRVGHPGRHERLRRRARRRRRRLVERARPTTTSRSSRTSTAPPRRTDLRAPGPRPGARSSSRALDGPNGRASCHNGLSRAVRRRAFDVDDGSEDSLSGQAAQSQARATAGQEGRPRQRPAQALPVLQGQDRAGRLQGRRHAAAVHLRARQDPLPPHHRRLPPPPEPDRHRGQARARARAAALRQRHARA